jgi:hypothetical protein
MIKCDFEKKCLLGIKIRNMNRNESNSPSGLMAKPNVRRSKVSVKFLKEVVLPPYSIWS